MSSPMESVQRLGRALMLPIAVLPVAGLLLRLGQPDLIGIPVLAAAGDAVFSNLGLLFAVGVAVGLARENHGAAGLASLVGFLVATRGAETLLAVPPSVTAELAGQAADLAAAAWRTQQLAKLSMPVGILTGLIAGYVYNRYGEIKLPGYLSFFGGRRFVPIVTGCCGVVVACGFGYGWPLLAHGMDSLSHAVLDSGNVGLFAYGVLNRILIVTGLHHILNNLAWFLLGDFHGVTGDLKRFFAGDPSAGAFMSGFFPVMMFGLPGACLAMYRTARPERRSAVGGLMLSIGLTSLLTGVTEPIEFTFMFVAPVLYGLHAVLTGLSMVLMQSAGVHLGFSFSAGLFDYVLNFSRGTRPLWLLPIGAGYFTLYYVLFRQCILRFGLATPGREPADAPRGLTPNSATADERAAALVEALGGKGNLTSIDACTTRLRLTVMDGGRVNAAALRALGALGVMRPAADAVQVVLGPIADQVAGEIRRYLRGETTGNAAPAVDPLADRPTPTGADASAAPALLAALGGRDNVTDLEVASGRLLVRVADPSKVDRGGLDAIGVLGVTVSSAGTWHVLLGRAAEGTGAALAAMLR
jgi:N-acetylglucosamine PTS system EIICBA or EIICB component